MKFSFLSKERLTIARLLPRAFGAILMLVLLSAVVTGFLIYRGVASVVALIPEIISLQNSVALEELATRDLAAVKTEVEAPKTPVPIPEKLRDPFR
jgi:hypothetical protein